MCSSSSTEKSNDALYQSSGDETLKHALKQVSQLCYIYINISFSRHWNYCTGNQWARVTLICLVVSGDEENLNLIGFFVNQLYIKRDWKSVTCTKIITKRHKSKKKTKEWELKIDEKINPIAVGEFGVSSVARWRFRILKQVASCFSDTGRSFLFSFFPKYRSKKSVHKNSGSVCVVCRISDTKDIRGKMKVRRGITEREYCNAWRQQSDARKRNSGGAVVE